MGPAKVPADNGPGDKVPADNGPGDAGRQPPAATAWRLTFRYDSDAVTLVARDRVATVAPPPNEAGEEGGPGADDARRVAPLRAGAWVEVRDATDRVVHAHALPHAVAREREVFSPDPDAPIRRVPVARPRGAFQVLVPDVPGAQDVVVHDAAAARETASPDATSPDAASPDATSRGAGPRGAAPRASYEAGRAPTELVRVRLEGAP